MWKRNKRSKFICLLTHVCEKVCTTASLTFTGSSKEGKLSKCKYKIDKCKYECLSDVNTWLDRNFLSFSEGKTEIVLFGDTDPWRHY